MGSRREVSPVPPGAPKENRPPLSLLMASKIVSTAFIVRPTCAGTTRPYLRLFYCRLLWQTKYVGLSRHVQFTIKDNVNFFCKDCED